MKSACHVIIAVFLCSVFQKNVTAQAVTEWLTLGDSSVLFKQQPSKISFTKQRSALPAIEIDETKRFQSIDGFGFALTQGSAMPIIRITPAKRAALLKELFDTTGNNIGISYIRLSIAASDLNETVFSYDDVPAGETDMQLSKFNLGADYKDVIPVMKQILAINPRIKILGSPWSPPAWMKTNNDTRGGRLKEDCYDVYARYLVKYIQQMKREGIVIDAITVQNEPLHPGNNPSILMTAPEQANFIKNNLGPAFKTAGIKTKIIIYDHNADRPDYPIFILDDKDANKYVDGSAFHLYGGEIETLTDVHNAHPNKHIYFTEQMVVQFDGGWQKPAFKLDLAWPVSRLFIGATRNWSRNVLEWNLAANSQFTPYTDRGGCSMCQGAISIDGDTVTRNVAYYAMAHASKFVRPGSVRISSTENDSISNVAFVRPDGQKVLIVSNTSNEVKRFQIKSKGTSAIASLAAGSAATYYWK